MFVDIEIIGAECDCCKMKTTTVRKCEIFCPRHKRYSKYCETSPTLKYFNRTHNVCVHLISPTLFIPTEFDGHRFYVFSLQTLVYAVI